MQMNIEETVSCPVVQPIEAQLHLSCALDCTTFVDGFPQYGCFNKLIFLICEHEISFNLFVSSSISFISIIVLSV